MNSLIKWNSSKEREELKAQLRIEIIEEVRSVCGNCKKLKSIGNINNKKSSARKNGRGVWESRTVNVLK